MESTSVKPLVKVVPVIPITFPVPPEAGNSPLLPYPPFPFDTPNTNAQLSNPTLEVLLLGGLSLSATKTDSFHAVISAAKILASKPRNESVERSYAGN